MRAPEGSTEEAFDATWRRLLPVGRDASGGYHRLAWTDEDLECREWFRATAGTFGLEVDDDANGNQWAWWGAPGEGALVTGSHLDSVPGGGAFDGPLGVVSGLVALHALRALGIEPRRPVAVVNFCEEEGGRFGVPCLGSRLMTGDVDPAAALARTDAAGMTLAEARAAAGWGSRPAGPDPERMGRIGTFVELHIEQGRRLQLDGVPVGVATAVWPHGRWRLDFSGQGNHAGTTVLADRRDPVVAVAHTVLAARRAAEDGGMLATVGRVDVAPGATNAIASSATAWLDARAPTPEAVRAAVGRVEEAARAAAAREGVEVRLSEESWSSGADFSGGLRAQVAGLVRDRLGTVSELPTGAGHDAAVLAATVPSAMLFVRNPTGVSHDPAEQATRADCLTGVHALVAVLGSLCR